MDAKRIFVKNKIKLLYLIVILSLYFLLIIISYPVILPLGEKIGSKNLIWAIYEPAELLRLYSNEYWKYSEKAYKYFGGEISPEKRYFLYSTRRRLIFSIQDPDKLTVNTYYKGGLKSGKSYIDMNWLDDGVLESTFKKGVKNGQEMFWAPNGLLIADGSYKNGKPWNGTFREYAWSSIDCSDDDYVIIKYKNGKKQKISWFNKDLSLIAEGSYKNGEPWNGTFIKTDLLKTHQHIIETFKDGVLISQSVNSDNL